MNGNEIERIAEYNNGEKVWRTSCSCMGDEHNLTFTVATDDEHPEVYLEFYVNVCGNYVPWDGPRWTRPFRSAWLRVKGAITLIFKGYVETSSSFIFRGEKQIDDLCETIQTHKEYMVEKRKDEVYEDVNIASKGKDNE